MTAPAPHPMPAGRLIWDLPLRLCHWLLALAVLGSWVTHKIGTQAFAWHVWFGYTVLVLTAFRVVWGFTGPRHARFSNFVRAPLSVGRYSRSLFNTGSSQRFAGHNPLGALMVLVLLTLLMGQALAGLFANDDVASTGPLYGYVSDATSDALARVHKLLAKLIWIAVWIHVAAVFAYALLQRVNLIVPMITGRKHHPWLTAGDAIGSSLLWRAVLIAAACAAILYWLIATAPAPSLILF